MRNLAKSIRIMRGVRQVEIAAALNRSQGWYSEWESGKRTATKDELQQIARVLGVEFSMLTHEEVEKVHA